jgi:hypothetical protein
MHALKRTRIQPCAPALTAPSLHKRERRDKVTQPRNHNYTPTKYFGCPIPKVYVKVDHNDAPKPFFCCVQCTNSNIIEQAEAAGFSALVLRETCRRMAE